MITFVYGAPGAGKTHYVFEALSKDPKNAMLIVPEQQTVICERKALRLLPKSAQLDFEVQNFSRLANRTFRTYGGLSYHYIGEGTRALLMWRTLRELAPMLEEYKIIGNETSMTPVMLACAKELKRAAVSSVKLEKAANEFPEGSPMRAKLRDTALILASYENLIDQDFDDAEGDLIKLCEIAKREKIFKGKKIYIDSFTSFTAPEAALIGCMFDQADEVTVTVGTESPSQKLICNESINETDRMLSELANSKINRIFLTENNRAKNRELCALASSSLWSIGAVSPAKIDESERGNVRIISCKNAYSEADAVVGIILSELERGLRYRDIAVIARDISDKSGILDTALDAANIPYFMSRGSTLAAKPVIRLISSALRIRSFGFRTDDVLVNLNTGLYPIDRRDADLFCEYVNTWSISGKRFCEDGWTMNPDGYTGELTERGKRILAAANRTRDILIGKLEEFFVKLDAADNAADMCRAVYGYFESIDLKEKLRDLASRELSEGNRREATDVLAVWNLMMGILDDIAAALGEEKLSPDEYLKAFMLTVSTAQSGAIPTGYDEVTLGSASLLRTDEIKCAIIVGMNEDEFPKSVKDSGIFSDAEREQLKKLDIPISSDIGTRTSEEFLYARRAISCPSDRLYMLYPVSSVSGKSLRPSLLIGRTKKLLPYLCTESYEEMSLFNTVRSLSTAVSRVCELGDSDEATALRNIMEETESIPKDREIASPDCKIDPETASLVLGDSLMLSQSKIDKYVLCGFDFGCEYLLGLRADEKAQVGYNIMGSFIHSLLEEILTRAARGDGIDLSLPEEETERIADTTIEKLIDEICPDDKKRSVRMSHLFVRLRRLSLLMLRNLREEFAHSNFSPELFEMRIGKNGEIAPLSFKLSDGSQVSLTGIVDRVDVMRKGGEVYIRVVDYKTGAKEFSLADVKDGLGLQLLIYLFSICKKGTGLAKSLGCEDGKAPIPAAAHYLSASLPIKKLEAPQSPEEVLNDASGRLMRSGIYRNDPEILADLNSEYRKNMLGGITQKDGVVSGKGLVLPEEFAALELELKNTVIAIAEQMKGGKLDAAPLCKNAKSPCEYCKMKYVCRGAGRETRNNARKENSNEI